MDPKVLTMYTVHEQVLTGICPEGYLDYLLAKAKAWIIPEDVSTHTYALKGVLYYLEWIDDIRRSSVYEFKSVLWLIILGMVREVQNHVREKTPHLFTDAFARAFFDGLYMLTEAFSTAQLTITQFLQSVTKLHIISRVESTENPHVDDAYVERATYICNGAPCTQVSREANTVYDATDPFGRIQLRVELLNERNSAHIQQNLGNFVTPENVEEAKQKIIDCKPYMRICACILRIKMIALDREANAMSSMPSHQIEYLMDPQQRAYLLEKSKR